jgi:hypothetical protein
VVRILHEAHIELQDHILPHTKSMMTINDVLQIRVSGPVTTPQALEVTAREVMIAVTKGT